MTDESNFLWGQENIGRKHSPTRGVHQTNSQRVGVINHWSDQPEGDQLANSILGSGWFYSGYSGFHPFFSKRFEKNTRKKR